MRKDDPVVQGSLVVFEDRRDAGRQLAHALASLRSADAVVVGLARGGVVVAAEVARALGLPLDALAVRKIGHPLEPEYAIGAVAPGGIVVLRASDGLTEGEIAAATGDAAERAAALDARLHARREPAPVTGRTCVLVDVGLATGATMSAAIRWARTAGSARVIVAVPVGAPDTIELLRAEADEVVSLETPEALVAVGLWYRDFRPVDDAEVIELLG
jgi:putative phosphoribosyl transferase